MGTEKRQKTQNAHYSWNHPLELDVFCQLAKRRGDKERKRERKRTRKERRLSRSWLHPCLSWCIVEHKSWWTTERLWHENRVRRWWRETSLNYCYATGAINQNRSAQNHSRGHSGTRARHWIRVVEVSPQGSAGEADKLCGEKEKVRWRTDMESNDDTTHHLSELQRGHDLAVGGGVANRRMPVVGVHETGAQATGKQKKKNDDECSESNATRGNLWRRQTRGWRCWHWQRYLQCWRRWQCKSRCRATR